MHGPSPRLDALAHVIDHAGHYLPAQGPITVFIHHNTLHAFEDHPFDEGVLKGSRLFGCQPYLAEDRYRQMLAGGRIRPEDLSAALLEDLGDYADALLGFLGTRFHFRLSLLQHPVRAVPLAELRWFVAETDALTRFRAECPPALRKRFLAETRHWVLRDVLPTQRESQRRQTPLDELIDRFGRSSVERWSDVTWEAFTLQVLWRICREGVHGVKVPATSDGSPERHRDVLLEATGTDSDLLVHDVLIRFTSAFVDQGLAQWTLPGREQGFFRTFCTLFRQGVGSPEPWLRGLRSEIARLEGEQIGPLDSILESLEMLGVSEPEWGSFITQTLLALRGWAGMVNQLEQRGDRVAHPLPPGSLVEFLAVRLLLDRLALSHVAREAMGYTGSLAELREATRSAARWHDGFSVEQRAFLVFQLAQVLGWLPEDLYRLSKQEWTTLVNELESFSSLDRRRVFHAAFERRYRIQTLDAIAVGASRRTEASPAKFQAITCIDEREESFRRHLEEIAPQAETFGAAGFFGVAMYYRGAHDAHFVPLCPVVIRPQHWVREEVCEEHEDAHRLHAETRKVIGAASHRVHVGSRTFLGGALVAAGLGVLASIPLVARILFPRLTALARKKASGLIEPPATTQLALERTSREPGPKPDQIGYSVEEMAGIVERLLRDIGLTKNLSRLVFVIGHGSSSLNNPHESAHDCGACGGGRGGPNARAFARMANDPRIRERLATSGLPIPRETIFVGAYHNTCDDSVTFYDVDLLPASHEAEFAAAKEAIDQARRFNAHERCRRFESAPLTISAEGALRHVEERSEDLAQTRPEFGHATNSVAFVGRRSRTRGLYLDRRTFLTSYDSTQDDADQTILTRILRAVVPVCAGINLEYYFSFVDPTGWGCGTKLPHNITSLLGVMDGAASDLRPGLPWQMVEIHDPVRLLMIVETTPEAMLAVMDREEGIGKVIRNGWIHVATLSPESAEIHFFSRGRFERYEPETTELPEVASSVDWYRGWREHLGYALVTGRKPSSQGK